MLNSASVCRKALCACAAFASACALRLATAELPGPSPSSGARAEVERVAPLMATNALRSAASVQTSAAVSAACLGHRGRTRHPRPTSGAPPRTRTPDRTGWRGRDAPPRRWLGPRPAGFCAPCRPCSGRRSPQRPRIRRRPKYAGASPRSSTTVVLPRETGGKGPVARAPAGRDARPSRVAAGKQAGRGPPGVRADGGGTAGDRPRPGVARPSG